ncbi:MAG: AAA family ATPase, partial [Prevotellaceae bacterium]|nr:AAA family ATPase [Prevotellaceae bacterium]
TDEQRIVALSALSSKFNKSSFVNIVEEPEQNLFPSSQWKVLQSLFEFNNMNIHNKLILTTHSPYLINRLTIAIKAGILNNKLNSEQKHRLYKIIPAESLILPEDIAIYELDEKDGTVKKLNDYDGIPSDRNYLNDELGLSNKLYDALLEIEEEV